MMTEKFIKFYRDGANKIKCTFGYHDIPEKEYVEMYEALFEKGACAHCKNKIIEPISIIYPSRVCIDFLSIARRDEEAVPTERRDGDNGSRYARSREARQRSNGRKSRKPEGIRQIARGYSVTPP